MKKKNRSRTVRAAKKSVVMTSPLWSLSCDNVVGGIAWDSAGLHLVKAWPDGDVDYELVPWSRVEVAKISPVTSGWFQFTDDLYLDAIVPTVGQRQQQLVRAIRKALLALPEQFRFRVTELANRHSSEGSGCGRERALQAALYGFSEKLAAFRKLSQQRCQAIAAGAVSA